jgi:hypothetical protein
MHLIDQSTADAGQFTDGNAGTGIPATVVDAKWLNQIQNEIANFITSRGIALSAASSTQLTEAILSVVQGYSSAPFAIGNNTTVAANVTGLILDKTKHKSVIITCDVYRKTATLEYSTIMILKCVYFPVLNQWKLLPVNEESSGELSGAEFFLDSATGQISYKTSNMLGGTYEGFLRYKLSRINLA